MIRAVWYYPSPSRRAKQIKDHVAFWNGVRIEAGEDDGTEAGVASRLRSWLKGTR